MNDEIKEILQKIENVANKKTSSYNGLIETKNEDYRLLLDYIINLQKENDSLNSYYEYYKDLADKQNKLMRDYKSRCEKLELENERLKETNVYCNRTDCIGRIKDSRKYDSVYQEKEDYKLRIGKAREFVNNNSYEYRNDMNLKSKALSITPTRFINMLLQILDKDKNELQGVGKDE